MRDLPRDLPNPQSPIPNPCLYACLYHPPQPDQSAVPGTTLTTIAQEFSSRYERHGDQAITIDVSGLGRLLGPPHVIGEELRRDATERGVRVHVAIAATQTAALVVALARPGLTIVDRGGEANAIASVPIGFLEKIHTQSSQSTQSISDQKDFAISAVSAFKRWGLRTLGEIAALPAPELSARLGQRGLMWQTIARGEDTRPLVPDAPEERFEASMDLEWPIEELEPLSFVLTRLLEPLSMQLERRDRGAAGLYLELRLVSSSRRDERVRPGDAHVRRLQLPSPMRDVRTLRTLLLLDLESHPPSAAVDRVAIIIEPTPARVLQHTLFTRARATPERLSTLLARLGALMGQDRIGAPVTVDSFHPGAFAMAAFSTEHDDHRKDRGVRREPLVKISAVSASSAVNVVSALRRCRRRVPARVAVADGRPVRVTSDRHGFPGGAVRSCAGPWRTSGEWWSGESGRAGGSGKSGRSGESGRSGQSGGEAHSYLTHQTDPTHQASWNRDEWDVALTDGAVYRVFRDRETDQWFIDAIVD